MRVAIALFFALLLFARPAAAAPREVVAVVIGANLGGAGEEPLRYAVSDARRVRDLLGELGDLRDGDTFLVTADDPAQVLGALRDAKQRAAALTTAGRHVMLLFYYSGHGDDGALHLAKGALPLKDVRAAIDDVPADLRLTILDACRTSGRAKGITLDSSFELATAADAPHGNVELRAAAVGEAAQESDELAGAVFTHFLVSGLRGGADTDGDGRVTLAELYAYTYRKTLLRTTTAPVVQHPSAQIDLTGSGEVVLTTPGGAAAFVEVPAPGRYLVFARPSGAAMGEVAGGERLALPAGKFVVIRRTDGATGAAPVDLSGGGTKRLAPSDFRAVAREEVARRGGDFDLRPRVLEGRIGGEVAPGSGDDLSLRVGAALSSTFGSVVVDLEMAYVGGPFDSDAFSAGAVHSLAGDASVGLRFLARRFTFVPFLGVELRYTWEHLVRGEDTRVEAAGFSRTENRSFGSIGPRGGVRGSFALGGNWSLGMSATFAALLRNEIDSTTQIQVHPVVGVGLSLGYAF